MRKLKSYVAKYGPVAGPRLYHALQSQAAHAGVSARLRRKIETLTGQPFGRPRPSQGRSATLPLFPDAEESGGDAAPGLGMDFPERSTVSERVSHQSQAVEMDGCVGNAAS